MVINYDGLTNAVVTSLFLTGIKIKGTLTIIAANNREITWVSWRLKSQVTGLFVQTLFMLTSTESSKLNITGILWGESAGDWRIPLTKGQ